MRLSGCFGLTLSSHVSTLLNTGAVAFSACWTASGRSFLRRTRQQASMRARRLPLPRERSVKLRRRRVWSSAASRSKSPTTWYELNRFKWKWNLWFLLESVSFDWFDGNRRLINTFGLDHEFWTHHESRYGLLVLLLASPFGEDLLRSDSGGKMAD